MTQDVVLGYYLIGLVWLLSGFPLGWLRWRGNPVGIAVLILAYAAIWPLVVLYFLWKWLHGEEWSDF